MDVAVETWQSASLNQFGIRLEHGKEKSDPASSAEVRISKFGERGNQITNVGVVDVVVHTVGIVFGFLKGSNCLWQSMPSKSSAS